MSIRKSVMFIALGLMIGLLLISSQSLFAGWFDTVKGSGEVFTKTLQFKGINAVELATIGDMYIEFGNKEELTIKAEDNIIDYFEIEMIGETLRIDLKEKISLRPSKPIKYYLTVKSLESLATTSAGDIIAPDFDGDKLKVKVSSAGDIELGNLNINDLEITMSSAGDVTFKTFNGDQIDVSISSAGDLHADKIIAEEAEIVLRSAGDARINYLAVKSLDVSISSAGDVRIDDGEVAKLEVRQSSSGDFRAENVICQNAKVRTSSSGDASLQVSLYLDAKTSSSGSIYFRGNPETVDSWSSSSGRVKKISD